MVTGDYRKSVTACVMYVRDNDSCASVAGAFNGVDAVPEDWIATVIAANPEADMFALSEAITRVIISERQDVMSRANALEQLL